MIQTLLLDADGVLIRGDMASHHFEEAYGISHNLTVEFYRGPFLDSLVDKTDMYDILPAYLKKWGWKKSTEAFVQEWFDFETKTDQALIDYVQKVRRSGIKCYVATNQERHRAQYMLEKMHFADSFDGLFASSHLGFQKPDPTFFTTILQRLAVDDPSSVLFWDDSESHVGGAIEAGIHAEHYQDFEQFQATMRDTYQFNI